VTIEIANESGISVDELALAALARYVLDEMRIHPLAELSVVLVDSATITDLHERWLGEAGPTDVLAFPMDELRPPPPGSDRNDRVPDTDAAPNVIGDVVLCPEVATEQAAQAQRPVADELELLCTHGILHLLGYDHGEPDERAAMFGLQDRLLDSWHAERAQYRDEDFAGTAVAGPNGDAGAQVVAAPGEGEGADGGEPDVRERDESG
jgi:probable rRNA maturation factor